MTILKTLSNGSNKFLDKEQVKSTLKGIRNKTWFLVNKTDGTKKKTWYGVSPRLVDRCSRTQNPISYASYKVTINKEDTYVTTLIIENNKDLRLIFCFYSDDNYSNFWAYYFKKKIIFTSAKTLEEFTNVQ